jgi:6-phosphofructokinase
MTSRTFETGEALAELLARENDALASLELGKATALYPRKQSLAIAFSEAREQEGETMTTVLDQEQQRLARELAERLRALAEENRRLLERAINVQAHVLGTVGRAIADAVPDRQGARYAGTGCVARAVRQSPVILSARA